MTTQAEFNAAFLPLTTVDPDARIKSLIGEWREATVELQRCRVECDRHRGSEFEAETGADFDSAEAEAEAAYDAMITERPFACDLNPLLESTWSLLAYTAPNASRHDRPIHYPHHFRRRPPLLVHYPSRVDPSREHRSHSGQPSHRA